MDHAEGAFAPSPTRLLYALRRAHLAVEARKERMLRDLDVLPAHYALLMNVWAHPGATGTELARHLGVTPQNVAALSTRLIDRGLLERRPHPRHAHVLETRMTDRGADLLSAADAQVAALERAARAALAPERADALTESLHDLRAAMVAPEVEEET